MRVASRASQKSRTAAAAIACVVWAGLNVGVCGCVWVKKKKKGIEVAFVRGQRPLAGRLASLAG
jgi:hypothetical protein